MLVTFRVVLNISPCLDLLGEAFKLQLLSTSAFFGVDRVESSNESADCSGYVN